MKSHTSKWWLPNWDDCQTFSRLTKASEWHSSLCSEANCDYLTLPSVFLAWGENKAGKRNGNTRHSLRKHSWQTSELFVKQSVKISRVNCLLGKKEKINVETNFWKMDKWLETLLFLLKQSKDKTSVGPLKPKNQTSWF